MRRPTPAAHPDDASNLAATIRRLRTIRLQVNLTQLQVAAIIGTTYQNVAKAERARWSPQLNTLQRHARALGYAVVLELHGLDADLTPETALLERMAASPDPVRADMAARALMLARMVAYRRQAGLEQRDLADPMGTTRTAVCEYESGRRESLLATHQAYARALGGSLTVRLEAVERVAVAA